MTPRGPGRSQIQISNGVDRTVAQLMDAWVAARLPRWSPTTATNLAERIADCAQGRRRSCRSGVVDSRTIDRRICRRSMVNGLTVALETCTKHRRFRKHVTPSGRLVDVSATGARILLSPGHGFERGSTVVLVYGTARATVKVRRTLVGNRARAEIGVEFLDLNDAFGRCLDEWLDVGRAPSESMWTRAR